VVAFELPEAMTVARQMNEELVDKRIVAAHLGNCDSLIRQGFVNRTPDAFAAALASRTIESVHAGGKWIFVRLDHDLYLLLALETGGKVLYHRSAAALPDRFHVRLDFAGGSFLTEQIVGWGWAKLVPEDELAAQRYPGRLGVSPVDPEAFTFEHFRAVLDEHGKQTVKLVLLLQEAVAGIGNGYLQDILFKARIHPKRKAGDLGDGEQKELHRAIADILSEAVRLGGREGERDLYDQPGGYQPLLSTQSKGRPCPVCGTAIEKLALQGTASYVCPACQKL
jgi:formamidopyrimidine-DNA glycosylase